MFNLIRISAKNIRHLRPPHDNKTPETLSDNEALIDLKRGAFSCGFLHIWFAFYHCRCALFRVAHLHSQLVHAQEDFGRMNISHAECPQLQLPFEGALEEGVEKVVVLVVERLLARFL